MAGLKKILLLCGRQLKENRFRELAIKHALENRGVEVRFAVSGRQINRNGYDREDVADAVFRREKTLFLENEWEFRTHMRGCDAVLFGTWKSYQPLVEMARSEGRPTLNYNENGGGDHWPSGVDHCLLRSPWSRRLMYYHQEMMKYERLLTPEQITITGSVMHERVIGEAAALGKEPFCRYYGLDPSRPIAVLFPKGVGAQSKKTPLWFPGWSEKQVDGYNQWFLDKYGEICERVREAGWQLLLKMHPTAYTSYWCKSDEEYAYWQRYPWIKVLEPQHTYDMFRHMDVGLSVTSHAAMDLGYFGKPCLFIDSDLIEPPKLPMFHIRHLCEIPLGPSSHWHTTPDTGNPWFSSWLGGFCRASELPERLNDPAFLQVSEKDWQTFVGEFWYRNDGRSAERIADFVVDYCTDVFSSWSWKLSGKRWRGTFRDVVDPILKK